MLKLEKFPSYLLAFSFFLAIGALSPLYAEDDKPKPAGNFSLPSLDGRNVTLDQFRGKYVLLNFWATWCGPCKVEMPSMEALYQRFKTEGLEVVAISNDAFGKRVVAPFVEAHKFSFTILLDQTLSVSHDYGVISLPTSFMIDPQGNIIGVQQGAENWIEPNTLKYFEDLLNKS